MLVFWSSGSEGTRIAIARRARPSTSMPTSDSAKVGSAESGPLRSAVPPSKAAFSSGRVM